MDFVTAFEDKLCQYTKFKHAVCCDCCTNAILMSLEALSRSGIQNRSQVIEIPKRTYLSVPMGLLRHGWRIRFKDIHWSFCYSIGQYVKDAACDFRENMGEDQIYSDSLAVCISFQQKKRLSLDQGGCVFTNSEDLAEFLRRMRHDGRNPKISHVDEVANSPDDIVLGWHAYMSPEKAARGILAMNQIQLLREYTTPSFENYPDISNLRCFRDDANAMHKEVSTNE